MRPTRRHSTRSAFMSLVLAAAILISLAGISRAEESEAGRPGEEGFALMDPRAGTVVPAGSIAATRQIGILPGPLAGRIRRPDGSPAAKVVVTLRHVRTGKVLRSGTTGRRGRYTFRKIPKGSCVLVAGKPGVAAVIRTRKGAKYAVVNLIVPKTACEPPDDNPDLPEPKPVLGSAGSGDDDHTVRVIGTLCLPGSSSDDPTDPPEKRPRCRPRLRLRPRCSRPRCSPTWWPLRPRCCSPIQPPPWWWRGGDDDDDDDDDGCGDD